jgi:perosamine synthetase
MKVVILAGGLGTRISEETSVRPKPMADIGGKPILWHIMKIFSANQEVAYKYKISSLQVALGLAQLQRIDELLARKREIFSWYLQELQGFPQVSLNQDLADVSSTYWMVTAVIQPSIGRKEAIIQWLADQGIDSRPFFSPLSSLPVYAGNRLAVAARKRNRVSYAISPHGVKLPSALSLPREQVSTVSDAPRRLVQKGGTST